MVNFMNAHITFHLIRLQSHIILLALVILMLLKPAIGREESLRRECCALSRSLACALVRRKREREGGPTVRHVSPARKRQEHAFSSVQIARPFR